MAQKKSYADQVSAAQVMLIGLKANQSALEKRGITADFIADFETLLEGTIAANGKQEALKAETKAATTLVDDFLAKLAKVQSEATTIVKLEQPKDNWQTFGITAKR
jgi:hypothetical protein